MRRGDDGADDDEAAEHEQGRQQRALAAQRLDDLPGGERLREPAGGAEQPEAGG